MREGTRRSSRGKRPVSEHQNLITYRSFHYVQWSESSSNQWNGNAGIGNCCSQTQLMSGQVRYVPVSIIIPYGLRGRSTSNHIMLASNIWLTVHLEGPRKGRYNSWICTSNLDVVMRATGDLTLAPPSSHQECVIFNDRTISRSRKSDKRYDRTSRRMPGCLRVRRMCANLWTWLPGKYPLDIVILMSVLSLNKILGLTVHLESLLYWSYNQDGNALCMKRDTHEYVSTSVHSPSWKGFLDFVQELWTNFSIGRLREW